MIKTTSLPNAALLVLLTAGPSLCADWSPQLAAQYLDSRQREWIAWPVAAGPGGTCFSCHTGMTYLLARPALRRMLGESGPTTYETSALDGLRARVDKREAKDVSKSFTKEPAASQAVGVEAIFAALFLPTDERALDRLWDLQLREGKAKGAWPWFSLALDPWEMPESPFYGAALAAIAAGNAPRAYRQHPEFRAHLADLAAYLNTAQEAQPLHNRIMLLWASTAMPEVLPPSNRESLIKEVLAKQEPDGGWAMDALGPWKQHPQASKASGSNSYATAFATFVMLKAGVYNEAIARSLDWLRRHQDSHSGYWEATSMNKHFEPGSMQDQFMRDAATGFAVMALIEAGEPRRSN